MTKPTLTELLKALRNASPQEREQLLEALQGDAEHQAVADADRRIELLKQALPGVADDYLMALMLGRGSWARVSWDETMDVVRYSLENHWEQAVEHLPAALMCCGQWGRTLLGRVKQQLEDERSAAEVSELQYVWAVASRLQGLADATGNDTTPDAVHELVKAFRAEHGTRADDTLFDQWTPERINLMLHCGQWVKQREPEIWRDADPKVTWRRVHRVFTKALERGGNGQPMNPFAFEQWRRDQAAEREAARDRVPPSIIDDLEQAIKHARAKFGADHPLKDVDGMPGLSALLMLLQDWYLRRTGIDPEGFSGFGRGRPT